MKKQISAIKGTKDILPREAKKWQRVESVTKRVLELYAYKEIRTPVFEATELFEKGTGQTTDIVLKEMYTFKDKAGRSLTLRPEYTPSVVRSIIENRLYLQPEPLRFYYIGPMFRYDKPQKGRYRQFHQVDIEVFGEEDPALDAEIVEMANYLLRELKVSDTENLVNSVGCKKCRPSYIKDLRSKAEKASRDLCPDCKRKVELNPLRIFDCKIETCREAAKTFPKITDYLCQECEDHFNRFCDHLAFYGIKYKVEPRLVRGIDYYTKTTFEIVSSKLGAQNALIGGGRYDDMMQDFGGPDLCAIGFAMGLERLISVVPFTEEKGEFLYLAYLGDESKRAGMKAVQFLRKESVECLIEYKERSIKNQMSRANKLGASWVLIIGEEEIKEGKYKLKNMASGLQVEGTQDEILKIIRESS
ncbi:MAG: histidine--tRNA ligase [Candidatus Aminicenantes bacterium]|nr:MAG: histidine--tRNA ligase [Candidatus Aminicenantes bacterium]